MATGTTRYRQEYRMSLDTQNWKGYFATMPKMTIRAERGVLRLVGGVLNNTASIVINTPTAVLELNNGAAFIEVGADGRTRASLLFGRELEMTSGGQSKVLVRPGFELVVTNASTPPSGPSRQPRGT